MSTSVSGLQLARAGLASKAPLQSRFGHKIKGTRSPQQAQQREAERAKLQTPRYIHEYQGPARGEIRGRARSDAETVRRKGVPNGNQRAPDEQPKAMEQVVREAGEVKPASASMWSRLWG